MFLHILLFVECETLKRHWTHTTE